VIDKDIRVVFERQCGADFPNNEHLNCGKGEKIMKTQTLFVRLLVAFVVGAAILAAPAQTYAGDSEDPIGIPGEANAFGNTYGEFSAAWWQWAYGLPDENHPVVAEGEVDCSYGQSGRVWFLAGTTGGVKERICTVPVGKPVLYPLINFGWVNEPGDCGRPEGCTVDEKRGELNALIDTYVCNLYSTVDGKPTVQIEVESPTFLAELNNDVFGLPAGLIDEESVADGFWVLLPPLSAGEHVLDFGGQLCDPGTGDPFWTIGATYNLTVER
jgi:hypothetical protein